MGNRGLGMYFALNMKDRVLITEEKVGSIGTKDGDATPAPGTIIPPPARALALLSCTPRKGSAHSRGFASRMSFKLIGWIQVN